MLSVLGIVIVLGIGRPEKSWFHPWERNKISLFQTGYGAPDFLT